MPIAIYCTKNKKFLALGGESYETSLKVLAENGAKSNADWVALSLTDEAITAVKRKTLDTPPADAEIIWRGTSNQARIFGLFETTTMRHRL